MYSSDNQELLRLFVEQTPTAVAMCDCQMRYLLTSRQWLIDYGLEKQNIIGCSHYQVFPNLPKQWQRSASRCLTSGIKHYEEDYCMKPDGSISWVKWEMHPWHDSAGEIGGLILLTKETAENKPAEVETDFENPSYSFPEKSSTKSSCSGKHLAQLEPKQTTRNGSLAKIQVLGQAVEWHPKQGCLLAKLPVVMLWIDTALASLMAAMQAMVGEKRFALALQSEGRKSIEADWEIISQCENFPEGIKALNTLARVAGWGELELLSLDIENKECRFRAKNNWEGRYQKALGVCWGNGMIAGKLSGYCSRLFKTNCWAEQTAFIARGDEYDEFVVQPSKRSLEEELDRLLGTDEATRADMAVALQKLRQEVAERQRAEEALAESEARNRAFLEAIPDMMFRVSKEGIIRDSRLPPEIELKTPRTQLLGKRLSQVLPQEVAAQALHYTQQCLKTGEIQVFECQLKLNNTWHFCEARIVVSTEAEVLAIVRDITQRKSAEEARRKSEELYRTLARNLPNGAVMLFDHQLNYTLAEGTDLQAVGLSKEMLEGKTARDVFPPDICEQLESTYQTALAGETTVIELPFANRLYLVHTLPVKNERGEIIAGMSLAQNITQAKQAEEALRQSAEQLQEKNQQLEQALRDLQTAQAQLIQSEKMSSLGQLVAGVAHEINNPVNFIYGNLTYARDYTQDLLNLLQLYQQHYPTPKSEIQAEIETIELDFLVEDLPKLVSSMEIGAERICEIVRSLRNFSRIDEAEMKEVDLHEGIDSTLLILQNRLKPKPEHPEIQIVKEYGDLPAVECYPGQLNQVFMNILTNAIDALEESMEPDMGDRESGEESEHDSLPITPDQLPTIYIRTEVLESSQLESIDDKSASLQPQNSPWVVIRIADNGPGMTAEVAQRLFDPFFTTKPIGIGTGLGLSISYQIVVEKHGGRLRCETALEQGTEFVIEIPIKQSENN